MVLNHAQALAVRRDGRVAPLWEGGAVITQQIPGVGDERFEDVKHKLRAVQVEVRCAD